MKKKISKILKDLYKIDPDLKEQEDQLKKAIQKLLENKEFVDDDIDDKFYKELRADILQKFSEIHSEAPDFSYSQKNIWAWFSPVAISLTVVALALVTFLAWPSGNDGGRTVVFKDKIDDWQLSKIEYAKDSKKSMNNMVGAPMQEMALSADNLGFSVGGSKDINNFRENIKNNYLPIPTDITAEGLFYDYYFDKGELEEPCDKLFCPSYSYAVSEDPISGEDDHYLSVGLNSNIKESDFSRKKLNLVVVLDISGSMSSAFNSYYYDNPNMENSEFEDKSKMKIATESIVNLMDHLDPEDRLGIVLFNNTSYLAKPLNFVGETDMQAIKDHILELQSQGGTNMSAGMKEATDLYSEFRNIDTEEYENRIIFLTDAMPNLGDISEDGLMGQMKNNAEQGIHSSLIGIGVDFNTELTEKITKIRGANYYSVHSDKEFKKRLDDEFEYMVTPLVFDLKLTLESQGFEIEKVYGSPEADESTGEIMKVNTLFPSETEDGKSKGGVVLLKLKKTGDNNKLVLKTQYEDRSANIDGQTVNVDLSENKLDEYPNTGIHKAIVLSRYTDLMKNWLVYEHLQEQPQSEPYPYLIDQEDGLYCPPMPYIQSLGPWERQSISLRVSSDYKQYFQEFKNYFESELSVLDDESLQQEIDVLNLLLKVDNENIVEPNSGDDWLLP